MTIDMFFILGYLFLILLVFALPITRKMCFTHIPELLTFTSGYFFLLADIKSSSSSIVIFNLTWIQLNTFLVICGILIGLFSMVASYLQKGEIEQLNEVKNELQKNKNTLAKAMEEHYNLCSDNIKELFIDFFDNSDGNGRVSLYKNEGEKFKLQGRYSNNPMYCVKGQDKYSQDEGFIAFGWQNGFFESHNIPSWTASGSAYRTYMKANCQIDDERLRKLTMRSRSFYIYRLNNHTAQHPHGVVVFEKLNESQIATELISQIFEQHEKQIVRLINSMSSIYQ